MKKEIICFMVNASGACIERKATENNSSKTYRLHVYDILSRHDDYPAININRVTGRSSYSWIYADANYQNGDTFAIRICVDYVSQLDTNWVISQIQKLLSTEFDEDEILKSTLTH